MTTSMSSVYNLKAVLHETGIKPDVLRAWERRYGLPMPQRTAGGHRLYSTHDIEIIKWLMARQSEGLSISHAVELWKEKAVNGKNPPAFTYLGESAISVRSQQPVDPMSINKLAGMDELRSQWISACEHFNESLSDQVINQAFALYPVEQVCISLLQRGLSEIGSMWYEGYASIQQEHFASVLALRRLDALLMATPAPTRAENIIVGCPAHEWHTFTPLLMALLIRRRGYKVIYLGANVPASYFVETIDSVKASLVVLAAQQLQTAATLQQSAALISAYGCKMAFGGRVFALHPDLVTSIPGFYLGNQMDGAVEIVENIILAALTAHPVSPPAEAYVVALKVFIAQRALVEATLNQRLGMRSSQDAQKYLGDNIEAALELGNMVYLDTEIKWLKVLLDGQKLPSNRLDDYLGNYAQVIEQVLSDQARPISEWFERYLSIPEM